MARVRTNSGRRLNELWGVHARHALYHRKGCWYERLQEFPGALFDEQGYILFESEEAYFNCQELRIKKQIWIPGGISAIPGYRSRPLTSLPEPVLQDEGSGELDDAFEEGGIKFQLHRRKERNRRAVERKKESVLARRGALVCEACDFDFVVVYGSLGVGFAECHRRTPLASLEEGHRTRLKDLAIVCANCHRMLHKGRPMQSVGQLRLLVESRRPVTPNLALQRTPATAAHSHLP